MNVSEYKFGDDEIQKLNEYRDFQPDVRLKVRFIALLMMAEGVEPHKAASILGKSMKTIENLNLIERFWRFVKDKLVRNKYYAKYKTFRAKTFQLLNHTDEYIDEFKTLMVEKFEIIKTTA